MIEINDTYFITGNSNQLTVHKNTTVIDKATGKPKPTVKELGYSSTISGCVNQIIEDLIKDKAASDIVYELKELVQVVRMFITDFKKDLEA